MISVGTVSDMSEFFSEVVTKKGNSLKDIENSEK